MKRLWVDEKKCEVKIGGKLVHVGGKDFSLLSALVRAKGRVLDRDFICQEVLGMEEYDDYGVLRFHICMIRRVVGKDRIRMVRKIGYALACCFLLAVQSYAANKEVRYNVVALAQAPARIEKLTELSQFIFALNYPVPSYVDSVMENHFDSHSLVLPQFILSMSEIGRKLDADNYPLEISFNRKMQTFIMNDLVQKNQTAFIVHSPHTYTLVLAEKLMLDPLMVRIRRIKKHRFAVYDILSELAAHPRKWE